MQREAIGNGRRREVFGLSLDPFTIDQAVARCVVAIERNEPITVGVVNAAKIVRMRHDDRLRGAVLDCDLVLADGQPIVWASRLVGEPLPERVAGIDLMLKLLAEAAHGGHRVYFLGARPDVLRRAVGEACRRFPSLTFAGARDGYFTDAQAPAIADAIRAARTDLLFLGMSSPKKELFEQKWARHTGAHVVHGVGGSFDVLAGDVRRAPVWWREHGLEWLYRAIQEPLRLGPRYLMTNARFLALLAGEIVHRRTTSRARR